MNHRPRWGNLRLRTKLALLIEAIVLVLGLATGLVATIRVRTTLEGQLSDQGLAIAGDLAMFSVRPLLAGDVAALRRFVNHTMSHEYVRSVAVLDPEGVVVMHSDLAALGRRPGDALARVATTSATPGFGATGLGGGEPGYAIFFPIVAADARLGTVMLSYSRAAAQAGIARARREIAWALLAATAVAGLLAFLLASYVSRPITTMAAAMRVASEGEVRAVPDVGTDDEVGVLASSFNKMAEDLSRHRKHLNALVEARTAELKDANARLEEEIAVRRRAEEKLARSHQALRDLASHLQSVREQERTEIARELHDELGQAMTALKMDLHWVGHRVRAAGPQVAARIGAMSKLLDGSVEAVRRISSQLRPKLLDDLGLSAAMEWQAREFERRSGVACRIRSEPDDIVVDAARSTALFRIFQETLTNVARHAKASRVEVVVRDHGETVEMTVRDDGKGIRSDEVASGRSLGILGMRERVRPLGGRLDLSGDPGRGTTVRVSIPVPPEGTAR
jgi:signal transduction histidine kinase